MNAVIQQITTSAQKQSKKFQQDVPLDSMLQKYTYIHWKVQLEHLNREQLPLITPYPIILMQVKQHKSYFRPISEQL